jgi:hypothetical protein
MNRRLARLVFVGFVTCVPALAALGVSCNDATGNGLSANGGMGGTGGMGGGAGVTSSAGGGGEGGIGIGGSCAQSCSNDLKKIVDCYGDPVKECPPEQGCHNGECIDNPCEVAKLSKSSYGCDYWALKTGQHLQHNGACFAAFIANTWELNVKINVEYDGQPLPDGYIYIPKDQGASVTYEPYDPVNGLGVGEVAILFLARSDSGNLPECPKPPARIDEVGVFGTGMGKAFHIMTDQPVVAYQILPYAAGAAKVGSATLLLPTSAWDVNYVAVNAYKPGPADLSQPIGAPLLDILAAEDNTTVTILPGVNIVGGPGVPAGTANTQVNYVLQKGQFLQIEQPEELTGSPIEADKAIATWGGSSCLYVPTDLKECDSAQQQIPPVKALGNEYVAVRYRGRMGGMDESVPWRLVGAVDDTMLTWEGDGVPANAPETLGKGSVVEFESTGPFVVRSQNVDYPFYLAAYMTGGKAYGNEGDAEWVNVVPPEQYLDNYVFFTDPTYPETSLVVVRKASEFNQMFADVNLGCLGALTGWEPLGKYEYTRVDLQTGNFQDVAGCSNGRHEMSSTLPFGVTVWGWGSNAAPGTALASYAYPAGASVRPINDVVVVPDPR